MKKSIISGSLLAALLAPALQATAVSHSGTLPVLMVNTEGNQPVVSKEDYLPATCYILSNGSGVAAVGSEAEPVAVEIRGRGNYTWTGFDKKPYKLKFDKKTDLLGTGKNKHYAILAHADDQYGFLRNTVGFELSRRLGLAWTPAQQPIEVYLNGEYIGLYMLTETIRIDSNRVDINEQADNETDPEAIKGGWLVEIDNYDTDPHVTVQESEDYPIYFTYDTPEILSAEQEAYLTQEMNAINDAIYASDKSSTAWEDYIDIDALARYYLVQEIMDDGESFHGSCYLYKDLADGAKWTFGPVWDFGNAFFRDNKDWIYEGTLFHQTWIGEIAKFPRFQEKVKEVWKEFAQTGYTGLEDFIEDFHTSISGAVGNDAERWPQYDKSDLDDTRANFVSHLKESVNWLGERLGSQIDVPQPAEEIYLRGYFNGWDCSVPFRYVEADDAYYVTDISLTDLADDRNGFKVATADWSTIDLGNSDEPLELNVPLTLEKAGGNIRLSAPLEHVDLTLDLRNNTLLATPTGTLGAKAPEAAGQGLAINGDVATAEGEISVFNASGIRIAHGTGRLELPSSGLLIVVAGGKTVKIVR